MDISVSQRKAIEFWFDFGSNYSYISAMRIEKAAAAAGKQVLWRPFLLGPIFKSFGWDSSPFVLQKAKGNYVWRDMERECEKYGIGWTRPTAFPRAAVLPLRVAIAASEEPWVGDFCKRVMQMNFVADRDIDSVPAVTEVLEQLQVPVALWLEKSQSAENKLKLRAQTESAQSKGIFGGPTFFVDGEMFWGNDRLDDALAWSDVKRFTQQ